MAISFWETTGILKQEPLTLPARSWKVLGALSRFVDASKAENHGMQCGFCTPGMAGSLAMLRRLHLTASRPHTPKEQTGHNAMKGKRKDTNVTICPGKTVGTERRQGKRSI